MNNQWLTIDFKGLDDQIYQYERIKSTLSTDIDRIILQAALKLENEVKRVITTLEYKTYKDEIKHGLVKTGLLRASVHSFVRQQFGGLIEGVVGTNVFYARFLEYGTGQKGAESGYPSERIPANYSYGDGTGTRAFKYMLIAWNRKKDEILSYVRMELRRVVHSQ